MTEMIIYNIEGRIVKKIWLVVVVSIILSLASLPAIGAVEKATYTDIWLKSSRTDYICPAFERFHDIPGMKNTINTKFSADLIIMFSSQVEVFSKTGDNNFIEIRALVDGQPAEPGSVILLGPMIHPDFVESQTRGFNFYKTNVPVGEHTINIQYKTVYVPNFRETKIGKRTLIIVANGAGH